MGEARVGAVMVAGDSGVVAKEVADEEGAVTVEAVTVGATTVGAATVGAGWAVVETVEEGLAGAKAVEVMVGVATVEVARAEEAMGAEAMEVVAMAVVETAVAGPGAGGEGGDGGGEGGMRARAAEEMGQAPHNAPCVGPPVGRGELRGRPSSGNTRGVPWSAGGASCSMYTRSH